MNKEEFASIIIKEKIFNDVDLNLLIIIFEFIFEIDDYVGKSFFEIHCCILNTLSINNFKLSKFVWYRIFDQNALLIC